MTKNAFTQPAKIDPAWLTKVQSERQKTVNASNASEKSPYGRRITAEYLTRIKK